MSNAADLSTLAAIVEEDTPEVRASKALSERIDMLQSLIDQLKTQDTSKLCVQEKKKPLEAEASALHVQRNSALLARKQLSEALGRKQAAMKAKDKLAITLQEAEAAVVKATEEAAKAKEELDGAVAEDFAADQDVVRLQPIVRSEEGRVCTDPIVVFRN